MSGLGPDINRVLSKVICTNNITQDVVYLLEKQRLNGALPTAKGLAQWQPFRLTIAEAILPHLDAYDQRT